MFVDGIKNYLWLMEDDTNWTPFPDDNLLAITDKNLINEHEAKGITAAELFILQLDSETVFSAQLILEIHKIAFSELYVWAGKWRTVSVTVGQHIPPQPGRVVQLMYQYIDNLNYKISNCKSKDDHIDCLAYAHHEFVRIHPFNNGNGRTGRMLMNLAALKLGYMPLQLYHREGDSRTIYINAIKSGDAGNIAPLKELIGIELVTL
jgi:cell filamentation protein